MRNHGTTGAYNAGCRCAACKAANTARMQGVRARLRELPFDEIPHGTEGGYSNYKCRCPDCTAASRVKWTRRRERQKVKRKQEQSGWTVTSRPVRT